MIPLLSSLFMLASGITAQPLVQLLPLHCEDPSDADLRRSVGIELRERLIEPRGPVPSDLISIGVTCQPNEVLLLASRPGRVSPPLRRIPLAGLEGGARARTVALAIAELVRGSEGDASSRLASPAAAPPAATVTANSRPPREDDLPSMSTAIGPAVGVFTSAPGHSLVGLHLRQTYLSTWLRVRPESPWWFGATADVALQSTTLQPFEGLTVSSFAVGTTARRRAGWIRPEATLGLRLARAQFREFVPGSLSASFVERYRFGSLFEVGVTFLLGKVVSLRGAGEAAWGSGVGNVCTERGGCVEYSGLWLRGTIDVMVGF